jgi:integrase
VSAVTAVDLNYLKTYTRRGKVYAYYRRGRFQKRLLADLGTVEFLRLYDAVHTAFENASKAAAVANAKRDADTRPGSISWLIASYRSTTAWDAKAPATKADYEKGLGWLESKHAHRPAATLNRPSVIALRELAAWDIDKATQQRTLVPSRANKVLTMVSILMEHAIDLGLRKDNPALGVAKLTGDGAGYRAWSDAEVAQFRERADSEWRFAMLLALGTGQRGQDLVAMRWADYDGSGIRVVQQKGRGRITLWIPCHPELRAALDARTRQGHMILTRVIQPRKKGGAVVHAAWPVNAFQKAAGLAIRDAELSGPVWHGLRPTAAGWLAEAGCPDAEIQAITGHTTAKMVQHYRRGAAQKVLATAAVARLDSRGRGTERGVR